MQKKAIHVIQIISTLFSIKPFSKWGTLHFNAAMAKAHSVLTVRKWGCSCRAGLIWIIFVTISVSIGVGSVTSTAVLVSTAKNQQEIFIYLLCFCVTFLFSDGQNVWNKSNSVSSDDEKCSYKSLPKEGDFIQHHNYMSYFPTKSVTSLENCTKSKLNMPYSGTRFKPTPIHQSRKYFLWSTTGNTVLLIFFINCLTHGSYAPLCVGYGLGIASVHPTFINR